MKNKNLVVLLLLLILTISNFLLSSHAAIRFLILILFGIKFLLVAFQFMELNKAHTIWKVAIISLISLVLIIIVRIG